MSDAPLEGNVCKTLLPAARRPRLAQRGFSPRPNKVRPAATCPSFLWAAASQGFEEKARERRGVGVEGRRGWLSLPAPPAALPPSETQSKHGAHDNHGTPEGLSRAAQRPVLI